MVLLYGIPGDGPFELVADVLEELNEPFIVVNPRQFERFDFVLYGQNGGIDGELTIDAQSCPLSDIAGVYNRVASFATVPEAQSLNAAAFEKYNTAFTLMNNWIECCSVPVLNKASAMSSNSSKPYQLTLIAPFFKVPETLITNSISSVADFGSTDEIIYKSASSVRSIVKAVGDDSLSSLKKIRHCPTLFQKKLVGTNYRVHVVGDEVFAIKISSPEIDYRYNNTGVETELMPYNLKKSIREKCIELSRALQLPLAGIDLFESSEGEWFCFEVNPSPGFSYFEKKTAQPIAKAVAKYLCGGSQAS